MNYDISFDLTKSDQALLNEVIRYKDRAVHQFSPKEAAMHHSIYLDDDRFFRGEFKESKSHLRSRPVRSQCASIRFHYNFSILDGQTIIRK